MEAVRGGSTSAAGPGAGVLAVGFGTTVAMWALGYVGRLPAVVWPSPVLLALFCLCLVAGGWILGRHSGAGLRGGLYVGLLAGLLNLLVLGSVLAGDRPNEVIPTALAWVPGSVALSAALAGLGALAGSRAVVAERGVAWPAVFVRVAIAATMLLLAVGGLVTSKEAGLAVVDWPNSYGYNMFLYPLSRMTGGVYYEHAHRLFGALVGLTTLVMAVFLQRVDRRPFVRRVAWVAFVMVVVQGFLGGLRVTGGLTLSTAPEDMAPNLTLAVLHGVLGQVFFATLVALGAFTSATWLADRPAEPRPTARTDRLLGWLLVGLLVVQLVLGALQRHTDALLVVHITMAAVVAPLALHVGFRGWGLNPDEPVLRRLGLGLVGLTAAQVLLGMAAFAMIAAVENAVVPAAVDVAVRTAHQWCGAILLGCAVLILCFGYRLRIPGDR